MCTCGATTTTMMSTTRHGIRANRFGRRSMLRWVVVGKGAQNPAFGDCYVTQPVRVVEKPSSKQTNKVNNENQYLCQGMKDNERNKHGEKWRITGLVSISTPKGIFDGRRYNEWDTGGLGSVKTNDDYIRFCYGVKIITSAERVNWLKR